MDKYQISSAAQFIYHKHEQSYRQSMYCGLSLFPLVLLIKVIFQWNYITLFSAIITSIFYYKNKNKWKYVIKIILYIALLFNSKNPGISDNIYISLTNQILVPYWPLQVLFHFGLIRKLNHLYSFLIIIAIQRALEILKRFLYAKICSINEHQQEQEKIMQNLPHHIMYFDENLIEIFCNRSIQFSIDSKNQLSHFVKHKFVGVVHLETQEKLNLEYFIKPWQGNFILVSTQFQSQFDSLFKQFEEQINKIYNSLCQDYTKWNNLRAFKMIKESDLSVLGQCLSECLKLDHQIKALMQVPQEEKTQFNLKITLCNLIESTIQKLYEHFQTINLQLENGLPKLLIADKGLLIFILQTLLFSTQFCDKQKGELSIKCILSQINQEKSGLELEFSFFFTCTPSVIKLYSQVFGIAQNKLSNSEQMLIHYLQNCKQMMKRQNNQIYFQTDGDSISVVFTFTSNISTQEQENMSQFIDITFSRIIINDYHFQWKEKTYIPPTKIILDQQTRNSLQLNESYESQSSTIKKIIINFPEIRDEISNLLETTLEEAKEKGLLDKLYIDSIEDNIDTIKCTYSEYADSIANSPPSFITPQIAPRKLQDKVKQTFKNLLRMAKKSTKKKKKPSRPNYIVIFPKRNESHCDAKNEPAKVNFNQEIITNRLNRQQKKWSHRCNVTQPPKIVNEVLCYIPKLKLTSEITNNFGNTLYKDTQIKEPIIVYEIANAIKLYKQYLENRKQFYYIMLFAKQQQEIADFVNIITKNEQEFVQENQKLQTYLVGVTESQAKPSLYAYFKYIIQFGLQNLDIKQIKALIGSQRETN